MAEGLTQGVGLSHQAFPLGTRLNTARWLLRTGWSVAQAAAEGGFDQSDLGQYFGATPANYQGGSARNIRRQISMLAVIRLLAWQLNTLEPDYTEGLPP